MRLPFSWLVGLLLAGAAVTLAGPPPAGPIAVRARRVELHYVLHDASPKAEVELWYSRDLGGSWHRYGVDPDGRSPAVFVPPGEGLYGFILVVRDGDRTSAQPPQPNDRPQRWAFVDYTPPLAQWGGAEPGDDFVTRRIVHLRWTAHDDHFDGRPVSLAYQSSLDQRWKVIAESVANVGRYDWKVPPEVTGQVSLKLTVRDRGGHVVERVYGPVPVERLGSIATTRPAESGASAEASGQPPAVDPPQASLPESLPPGPASPERRRAEELYRQGSWHLVRGQYAPAAERFREALELDPQMIEASNDLAGICYLQKNYDEALRLYLETLKVRSQHEPALRGAALAYVARRDYAQSRDMLERLLAANGDDAEARLDLGDVLFMMGDRAQALREWQEAASTETAAIQDKARRRLDLYGPAAPAGQASTAAGKR